MLPVNAAVRLLALQYAPLVSLIGDLMVDGYLDQTERNPGIAYRRIGGEEDPTLNAETRGMPGKASATFLFFSTSRGVLGTGAKAQAFAIDAALRMAILGYQGTVSNGSSPADSLPIQGIFFEFTRDFYDDETGSHQVATAYEVHYQTERPS